MPSRLALTAVSLAGLAVLLAVSLAPAQEMSRSAVLAQGSRRDSTPGTVLYFSKSAGALGAQAPAELLFMSKQPGSLVAPSGIQMTALAEPTSTAAPGEEKEYEIQLEPPGLLGYTRADSEKQLFERIRQETRGRRRPTQIIERVEFPTEPVLATGAFTGRHFPAHQETVEPNYVCHGRLYFEEKNSERYGWDLGIIQPLVSAALFYKDVVLLPYHIGTEPCRHYECSAGYCLPGDAVPYLIYPPEISLTGLGTEAAVAVSLFFIFP